MYTDLNLYGCLVRKHCLVSLDGGTFVQYQAEEKEVDEVGHLSVVSIISESIKLIVFCMISDNK